MENNVIFAVTSYSSHENGEIFFGLDDLFASKEEAERHIYARMNEELEEYVPDLDGFVIDRDAFKIEGPRHSLRWELRECVVPSKKEKPEDVI